MWPRRLRRLLSDRSLAELVLSGHPVIGYTPGGSQFQLYPQARALGQSTVPAPTVSSESPGDGQVRFRRLRRSGGGSKESWFRHWGPFCFHHIVDPSGPPARWSIITQDLVRAVFTSGDAWLHYGFVHFNASPDQTTKVGAMWHIDSTDQLWTSGVYGGTGTPSTTLHETQHADLDATGPHRLATMLDAESKSVLFYANGVLVDTYTPASSLGQMGNTPLLTQWGITDTGADAALDTFGGGNPRFLVMLPVS